MFYKISTILFILISQFVFGQAGSYYDVLNVTSPNFVTDLGSRISSPYTQISYDRFDETNIANFASIDNGNGTRSVFCVYSNYEYVYTPPFTWLPLSREHTFCHSWQPGYPSESLPEYSDQHHLFPTNQNNSNGVRSNHPLGNVVNVISTFLDAKYGTDINGKLVYEPRNEHKGDAARAILYMPIRYNGINGFNWTFNWLNNTRLPFLSEGPQDLATLIQWHKQDPPNKWEADRNNYIQSIQGNRNPLVDHPEYMNYINFSDLTKFNPTYALEPTNYVTSFSSLASTSSITFNWTDAIAGTQAPSYYLLIIYNWNNYFLPIDGESYLTDSDLSDGKAIINIPYSEANTYELTGLSNNTTYYGTIFSYNGSSTLTNYKIDGTFPVTSVTFNGTFAAEPTNYVTNLASGLVTSSSEELKWTKALEGTQAPSGYLLLANKTGVFSDPIDGTVYSDNTNLAGGSAIVNIPYTAIDDYSFSGLASSTTYYFKIYSYNGSGTQINYKTDGTVPTLAVQTSSGGSGGSLGPGDIAIVGFNMTDPDEFAFVPLVDLTSGTAIKFTDNGWFAAGGFRSNEGIVTYTASSNISKGTVIRYISGAQDFTSSGSFALSTSGDQILAYIGNEGSPTFLFAINDYGSEVWQADAISSNTSAIPSGLTNRVNAVALNQISNAIYNGPIDILPAQFLASVTDPANWSGSNTVRQTMPTGNFPLPVELTSFDAKVSGNKVLLNWETATEVNNYGFEVERASLSASPLRVWEKIGFVNGNGNSNSSKSYSFVDANVTESKYTYRLKQIDNDGQFEYSKVVEVDLGAPSEFELSQNYPNPFNPTTTIKFTIPEASLNPSQEGTLVKLTVFNILGQQVAVLVNDVLESGVHTINFDASELNSGIYVYRIAIHSDKLEAGAFIQSKKMTLIK